MAGAPKPPPSQSLIFVGEEFGAFSKVRREPGLHAFGANIPGLEEDSMKPGSLAAASLAIAATLPLAAQQPTPSPAPAYSSYDSSMSQPPPKRARPH